MRSVTTAFVLAATALVALPAWAQEAPKKLWTRFDSTTAHAQIAGAACQMQGRTMVAGQYKPLQVHAQEDNAVICWSSQPSPDAVHVAVIMTTDPTKGPNQIVLEIDAPEGTPPNVIEDFRSALRNTEAELQRRVGTVAPPQVVQVPVAPPPPPIPMHPEPTTNWGLIGAGIGTFAGGYLLTALMGAVIVDASGNPGTPRWWPFVPAVGATVFTATYVEAPNCKCSSGRVLSVLGGVFIDVVQVAGIVMMVVGAASPKTRMVPDAVGVRIRPDGMIEGRF